MPAHDPEVRALVARVAAHERWANEDDRAACTQPARDAFRARFERQVDPNNQLDPAERARRAEHAMRAHMLRLSLRSARSRAARKTGRVKAFECTQATGEGERYAAEDGDSAA